MACSEPCANGLQQTLADLPAVAVRAPARPKLVMSAIVLWRRSMSCWQIPEDHISGVSSRGSTPQQIKISRPVLHAANANSWWPSDQPRCGWPGRSEVVGALAQLPHCRAAGQLSRRAAATTYRLVTRKLVGSSLPFSRIASSRARSAWAWPSRPRIRRPATASG